VRKHQVTVLPAGLREWRKVRGLTQVELAKRAGCSDTLVALIETGRRQPGIDNARAIADVLGVPLDAFAVVHGDTEDGEVAA
jgi:transcriptional regulator with XRE-family HTH domain